MNELSYKILFVCMGNICRSPTAEAVFYKRLADRQLLNRVKVDSAGTHNFHPDAPPDQRSQAQHLHKVRGLAEFLQTTQASVIPDPYDGGEKGFEHILDLYEEASEGLMEFVHPKVHT